MQFELLGRSKTDKICPKFYVPNGQILNKRDRHSIYFVMNRQYNWYWHPSNNFSVNFPLGTSYTGTYEIENNILICTATQEINREGGGLSSDPTNEIFEFKVIDSNNLELYKTSNEIFDLTIGMNYVLNN